MQNERRRSAAYNRSFYMTVASIFALVSFAALLTMIFQGVTEVRLFVTLSCFWYLIYMMDLIERRFQRDSDNVFWRKLFQLRGTPERKDPNSTEDSTPPAR